MRYLLLLIFILCCFCFSSCYEETEVSNLREFTSSLQKGDVSKIEVINQKNLYYELKNDKKKTKFYLDIDPNLSIVERVEDVYENSDIPKSEWVLPVFSTREDWIVPLLGWYLPIILCGITKIPALIVMLYQSERFEYYKIIWSIIIIFVPLGWLIFFVVEFLYEKWLKKVLKK